MAALHDGNLCYAAELTRGFGAGQKAELARRLAALRRPRPVVCCPKQEVWVEAEHYCRVRFLRRTAGGRLRDARFGGLVGEDA